MYWGHILTGAITQTFVPVPKYAGGQQMMISWSEAFLAATTFTSILPSTNDQKTTVEPKAYRQIPSPLFLKRSL
jgi:hypothetical protein